MEEKEFDAVIVCIGNYYVPNMPTFQGVESFKGSVIHSHDYRTPEPYKQKKILLIGSGPSAIDIARIVVDQCENVSCYFRYTVQTTTTNYNHLIFQIFMSFRGTLFNSNIHTKIKTKPMVKEFKQNSVIFNDNSEEEIDSVIVCTGKITLIISIRFIKERYCSVTRGLFLL